jgi:precorrin-6B methylase 2
VPALRRFAAGVANAFPQASLGARAAFADMRRELSCSGRAPTRAMSNADDRSRVPVSRPRCERPQPLAQRDLGRTPDDRGLAFSKRSRVCGAAAVVLIAAAAIAASPAPTLAQPGAAPYTTVAPSPDGIGKLFAGREIARVMSWHGAAWLERPERSSEERPDLVLEALALAPGMKVADVGAGTGFYSWRIAERVGDGGRVYAVEVQPQMLDYLGRLMARRGVKNVEPVLGTPSDPRLAPGSVDVALMVDVYHELEFPYEMLARITEALRPGGRLVFVEYRGEDPSVPIKPLHKMTEAQVRKEAEMHPLAWERTIATLPWQHVIVFRKSGG